MLLSYKNDHPLPRAGAAHGQELPPHEMEALVRAVPGRTPAQRTTLYGTPPEAQRAASLSPRALQPLAPLVMG
jgi:FO synthase